MKREYIFTSADSDRLVPIILIAFVVGVTIYNYFN